jgi:hypothetical protein
LYLWLAAAAFGAGAVLSRLKLWYHCRAPESEACVWSRAYEVIAFPLETLVGGAVIFALLAAATWRIRSGSGPGKTP